MALLFANNASSKLDAGINDSVTTITVTAGDGAKFPVISGGNTCMITVQDSTGAYEIMSCTARTTDSLTVVRAQESTSARAFSAGATVANRFTAGTMTGYAQTSAVAAGYQPLDASLTALAAVTTAADKLTYSTAADTFTTTTFTAAGRALVDDAAASDQRTTLGLAIGTDVQAYDADTMKSDVHAVRTKSHPVTKSAVTDNSLTPDLTTTETFDWTPTGAATLNAPTVVGAGTWVIRYNYASAPTLPKTPLKSSAWAATGDMLLVIGFGSADYELLWLNKA